MSETRAYLAAHATKHPAMRPQDVVKLCYQAAFGAEHLLPDIPAARACFMEEFDAAGAERGERMEPVSDAFCRVNFRAWKAEGLPSEWLFNCFALSAKAEPGAEEALLQSLAAAQTLANEGAFSFSSGEFRAYVERYLKEGARPVRHSREYRAAERPSYRLVRRELARLFPLLVRMAAFSETGEAKVVAVDGRAASGKTTLAARLAAVAGAGVAHMDDFFLPPELRTKERLALPGGNAHYERFLAEVLPRLRSKEAFSYGVFDCGKMALSGRREVAAAPWRVVEGAYCCHPRLGDYADIQVFSDIDKEEQLARVRAREGKEGALAYLSRWIPLEEAYFAAFGIRERADIVL